MTPRLFGDAEMWQLGADYAAGDDTAMDLLLAVADAGDGRALVVAMAAAAERVWPHLTAGEALEETVSVMRTTIEIGELPEATEGDQP